MTELPAHVTERTETTATYRCTVDGSRLILGGYETPDRAGQVLAAWLLHHAHVVTQGPTS